MKTAREPEGKVPPAPLPTDDDLALGIDVGTSSLKAAIYDSQLRLVVAGNRPTDRLAASRRGEMDPEKLWLVTCELLADFSRKVDLRAISAIGIAGMAESGCLIDERNRPITPIMLWHDRRGIRQAAALRRKAGNTFARISGLRTTSVRSIAKWRWLAEHGAPYAARWCGAPEWIFLHLTGQWQTDSTLAVRSGAFDVLRGEYSPELLEIAGAPADLFPPVRVASSPPAAVLPDTGRHLGLSATARVMIAGHDDIVAAYGAGGELGDLIDSGGTAEGLLRVASSAPQPADTVAARMAMTRYFLPSTWALLAGAGSTGALLNEVARRLDCPPSALDAIASPPSDYPRGILQARLGKESLPVVHIRSGSRPGEVWSAALDLVSDRFARAARRLQKLAGSPSRLILIGGQARSRELALRKSSRVGLAPVIISAKDATTRGAAALALSSDLTLLSAPP